MRIYIYIAVALVMGATHFYTYQAGKAAVHAELLADRIKIFKDGKEIDAEVLAADDTALCALLGGCLLPDVN